MKTDQLKRANELEEQINSLKNEKGNWINADQFYDNNIRLWKTGSYLNLNVKSLYINFPVVKALTLATIEEQLTKLKDEFDKL